MEKLLVKSPKELLSVTEREKQQKQVVAENPLIKDVDKETYEEAKKRRTTLVKARTGIENESKAICSNLAKISKDVKEIASELISITLPHEEAQQAEVRKYETVLQEEIEKRESRIRKEKEVIIELCNNVINDLNNAMSVKTIDVINNNFLEDFAALKFSDELQPEAQANKNRVSLAIESRRRLLDLAEKRLNEERDHLKLKWAEIFNSKLPIPQNTMELKEKLHIAEKQVAEIGAVSNQLRIDISNADLDELKEHKYTIETVFEKTAKNYMVYFLWDGQKESLLGQIQEREKVLLKMEELERKEKQANERIMLNKQHVELFGEYPDDNMDNASIKMVCQIEIEKLRAEKEKKQEQEKLKQDKILQAKMKPTKDELVTFIASLQCTEAIPGKDWQSINDVVTSFVQDINELKARYINIANSL